MIVYIIIIIVIILLYFKFKPKVNTYYSNEIIQINNFSKNKLEKYIQENQPIVLINTLTEFNSFETLCFEILKSIKENLIGYKKNKILDNDGIIIKLDKYCNNINNSNYIIYNNDTFLEKYNFENLDQDINILLNDSNKKNYTLTITPANINIPITKCTKNRTFLLIYDGNLILNLINPTSNPSIDKFKIININNNSVLSINDISKTEFKVLQIICKPGKIISIPKHWYYYYSTIEPSIIVTLTESNILDIIT